MRTAYVQRDTFMKLNCFSLVLAEIYTYKNLKAHLKEARIIARVAIHCEAAQLRYRKRYIIAANVSQLV